MSDKNYKLLFPENLERMSEKEIKEYLKKECERSLENEQEERYWSTKAHKLAPFLCFAYMCGVILSVVVYVNINKTIGTIAGALFFFYMCGEFPKMWYRDAFLFELDRFLEEKERRINAKQYNNRR